MSEKFPVISIFKQAFGQTLAYRKGLLLTAGLTLATFLSFYGLARAVFGDNLSALVEAAEQGGTMPAPAGDMGGVLWFLLALFVIMVFYARLFNMWVRYGAFGDDGVAYPTTGGAIQATLVTMLKLVLITVLLGIVFTVVSVVLELVGVIPRTEPGEIPQQSVSGILLSTLVLYGTVSAVYSLFSSNLTQTALGSNKEEVGPPHVPEFAVVLFLINVAVLLPLSLLGLVLPLSATIALQFVGYVLLTAAIPVSHGLRYDWQRQIFAGETAREQFGVSQSAAEAKDTDPDGKKHD